LPAAEQYGVNGVELQSTSTIHSTHAPLAPHFFVGALKEQARSSEQMEQVPEEH